MDGVKVIFDSQTYGRYFEAIPITEVEVLQYTSQTTYTAPENVVLYQVQVGDITAGDKGVIVNGVLIVGIIAGVYYLKKGQSIDLVGDFIVIK